MEQFKGILFIDIETVPIKPDFHLLSENMKEHWLKKMKNLKSVQDTNVEPAAYFNEKAGVYSEFSKVVCIGFGSLNFSDDIWKMRLKYLANDNEKLLLNDFYHVSDRFSRHFKNFQFCGHNIKEFDIPFLCRRMLINGITLPNCMEFTGKKPWEVSSILDTMDMWKFGDHKHFTTLALLAEILGIPSPKSDIDGSQVAEVYWHEKDLARIGKYCLQDVLTTAKIFFKLKGIFDTVIEPVFLKD